MGWTSRSAQVGEPEKNCSSITHDVLKFFEHLNTLPYPPRRNIGQIQELSSVCELINTSEYNNLIGMGDASVSNESFVSHTYILKSMDEKHRIRGVAPVDCDKDDVDSTRAEKSGVLALVPILCVLEEISNIGSGRVTIYFDNLKAVCI